MTYVARFSFLWVLHHFSSLATVYGKCLLFLNIVNQENGQPVGNKIGDEYIGLQTGPATWRARRDLQIGM